MYISLCDQEKMLKFQADQRTVCWIATYHIATAVAWQANVSHPVSVCITVILLMYLSFAGACITHNSMHCRTFTHDTLETLWRHSLSLTYGHPVCTFVPGHNKSHHVHTQSTKDPMRTSKLRYKWNWLNVLLFQPTVAADVFKMDMRYLALKRHTGEAYYGQSVREWIVLVLTQVALLCLNPTKFMAYVWLPHIFAQWAIVTMNLLQHDGCETDEACILNGSRNFIGPITNYLTFNNGYHTIHHIHPTLHWSQLPKAHTYFVEAKCHPNLNQKCMARYIYTAFIYPGKRVDYYGEPVILPENEKDEDWTIDHAPDGVTLKDYDFGWQDCLWALPWLPCKLLCPTSSVLTHAN